MGCELSYRLPTFTFNVSSLPPSSLSLSLARSLALSLSLSLALSLALSLSAFQTINSENLTDGAALKPTCGTGYSSIGQQQQKEEKRRSESNKDVHYCC